MRYIILGAVAIYAYLLVDGLENESKTNDGKKSYRVRAATLILAAVAAVFAQSANSLEGKLQSAREDISRAQYQSTLLQNEISNLKFNNTQLQQKLDAATFSSLLEKPAQVTSQGNGATAK